MGCTAAKMEHAGTDNINGGADIEEPRAEIQSLKDENQALKDKVQALEAEKALEDKVQSLKAGSTPDGSDKFGTSRKVALESATKWAVAGWVNSLELTEVVAKALKEPPSTDPFEYVCNLSLADLTEKLEAEKLSGLVAPLWSAVEKLRGQGAATGAALNAKFAAEGDAFKGEMGFGGVKQYFGGLEALIGPPLMVEGSLLKAMEEEHCNKKDANLPFDTSNGIKGSTPRLEWEFVVAPVVEDPDGRYAERGGDFRTVHPVVPQAGAAPGLRGEDGARDEPDARGGGAGAAHQGGARRRPDVHGADVREVQRRPSLQLSARSRRRCAAGVRLDGGGALSAEEVRLASPRRVGCDGGGQRRALGRGALDVEQQVHDHHPRDQLDHRQAVAADQDHAALPRLGGRHAPGRLLHAGRARLPRRRRVRLLVDDHRPRAGGALRGGQGVDGAPARDGHDGPRRRHHVALAVPTREGDAAAAADGLAGAVDGRGGQHARRPVQLLHQHGLAHARAGGGQAP
mmetsp:Transcript_29887/g.90939  ORF Transcript_29887/g.90939 Transcript_29887/m.90939 type:complete len:515 (+) Transcript_29887:36-1580(+)